LAAILRVREDSPMRLENKVAFISGSTRGIGRTTAEMFAEEGAKVVVSGRSVDKGEKNVQRIRDAGGEAMFVRLDVADETSVQDAIAAAVDAYGPITTLINNAAPTALVNVTMKPILEMTTEEWDGIMRGTVTSAFWMAKYTVPHMIEAGGGSIVNVSSGASVFGVPGLSAYASAKGGMNSLTRVMAVEFGQYGIRCNTIIVGRVVAYAQDRGPDTTKELSRVGNPRDIGYAALWLAADESEWITGSEITADGGARYNQSEL
jgi:NAD(P)-dependent dehydrogenase (short-subunit alcohol dehydrogenase family)